MIWNPFLSHKIYILTTFNIIFLHVINKINLLRTITEINLYEYTINHTLRWGSLETLLGELLRIINTIQQQAPLFEMT